MIPCDTDVPGSNVSFLQRSLQVGWSVARTAWRSRYNRLWRFAKFKWVVFGQLAQLGFIWWLSSRVGKVSAGAGHEGMIGISLILLLQFGWSGLVQGFLNGQYQLFKGSLNPLFEVSSAPPIGFIFGRVLEHVPRRIWSTVLWSWAYTSVFPHHGGIGWVLGLAGMATMAASMAFLTGMLSLILWQALAPRTVRYGLTASMVIQILVMTWAAIYLSQGGTISEVVHTLIKSRYLLVTLVGIVAALPGLCMLVMCICTPTSINRLYNRGLMQLNEIEQGIGRAKRSLYIPYGSPLLRAVLSREWTQFIRAPFTNIRMFTYIALLAGEYEIGRSVSHHHGNIHSHANMLLLGVPLVAWLLLFSGDCIMAFASEGASLTLYRMSGLSANRVMVHKWIGLWIPNSIWIAIACLIGGVAEHGTIKQLYTLIGVGVLTVTASVINAFGVSAGYLDPDADELGQAQNNPGSGQMGAWGLVGMVAACIPPVLVIYLQWGTAWSFLPIWSVYVLLVVLPVGIWLWGSQRLRNRFAGYTN